SCRSGLLELNSGLFNNFWFWFRFWRRLRDGRWRGLRGRFWLLCHLRFLNRRYLDGGRGELWFRRRSDLRFIYWTVECDNSTDTNYCRCEKSYNQKFHKV